MSKVVCDVCGTSFPETATHCPICGCVRPADTVIVGNESGADEATKTAGYTYVKGGRFSRSNVKKRSSGRDVERVSNNKRSAADNDEPKDNGGDKGLVVAVCLLLLAIICVVIYIVIHFFNGHSEPQLQNPVNNQPSTSVSTEATTEPTIASTPAPDLSCTAIVLSQTSIELEIGGTAQLAAVVTPDNTSDLLSFASADESVAKVSADGTIEAIAAGETTITAICGEITSSCAVVVKATAPDSQFVGPFKLNKTDVSISIDETFQLKLLDANKNVVPVTWSVEDSSVCTVDGNTVKGASKGKTIISVNYGDETYSCTVRVR